MKEKDKLKYGNSLETQFWSDKTKIDSNSPLTKLIDKIWNTKNDYIPTKEEKEQFKKDMEKNHKKKKVSTQK